MPGGLLNIVAYGQQNIILNGNPSKSFFKCTYAKYTNFGLQKFRIDFNGQRTLRLNEDSKFTFKIPRYADLLMDTYLVITLPSIWSPIYPPQDCEGEWIEYGFKWIKNLGTQMIKEIHMSIGGQTIAKFSGQYLYNLVERDFSGAKKDLYYKMTGNVPELNDPANSNGNINVYPNAYYNPSSKGPEPSIRARKLYIPINAWFTLNSKMALPLVALQYNELHIDVTLRSIQELFTIQDIGNEFGIHPYVQPNFNNPLQGFYRFLQPPPDMNLNFDSYTDQRTNWNADIHLISTYAFLSDNEVKAFAANEQKYLIKDVHEYNFYNVTGSQRVILDTLGMVSNWMWYFQRNDANLRNEWSNYTNWPYDYLPYPSVEATSTTYKITNPCDDSLSIGPGENPTPGSKTGYFITPEYTPQNEKNILRNLGILMDGKYRENVFDAGVYNYVEKYVRTSGNSEDGLYCYNFGLNTNPFDFQPSGAMNMSRFTTIELEFNTIYPVLDPSAAFYAICDPNTGTIVGVNKPSWIIYDYNFDLTVFEERYNVLTFMSGNAGLQYAR
ncbi:MAG: major capsid protein [Candidatus Paceibacterota bacterium]